MLPFQLDSPLSHTSVSSTISLRCLIRWGVELGGGGGGLWETCLTLSRIPFFSPAVMFTVKAQRLFGFQQFSRETRALNVIHDEETKIP